MNKILSKLAKWKFEQKTLLVFVGLFVCVILSGWIFAMKLKQTVAETGAVTQFDPSALIEVEKMRAAVDAQIASARSFFSAGI